MATRARNPADTANSTGQALRAAVHEVLGAFASATVRAKVLERALWLAGYSTLPTSPAAFEKFMVGPLAEAIDSILGPSTSRLVLSELTPLVRRALAPPSSTTSGVRARASERTTTISALRAPRSLAPEARPTVRVEGFRARAIAVSPDAEARLRLTAALGPGALSVATLDALDDALDALGDETTVIIIDLRMGRVSAGRLAALRDGGRRLVLWGGRDDVQGAAHCAAREAPEQVAALVAELVSDA